MIIYPAKSSYRYGAPVCLANSAIYAVEKSAAMVQESLDRGEVIYGLFPDKQEYSVLTR